MILQDYAVSLCCCVRYLTGEKIYSKLYFLGAVRRKALSDSKYDI
jgi:hypothetical protein